MPTTTRPELLAIFDHDGVLVDSLAFPQEAWVGLGQRAGLPITRELVLETSGLTNPKIFERLVGDQLPPDEVARLGDLKEACYRALARGRIVLMDGVIELIDALAERVVALAIGTSGPRANSEPTISSTGLDGRFAALVALADVAHASMLGGRLDQASVLRRGCKGPVLTSIGQASPDRSLGIGFSQRQDNVDKC